jgi:hypothetical protein
MRAGADPHAALPAVQDMIDVAQRLAPDVHRALDSFTRAHVQ